MTLTWEFVAGDPSCYCAIYEGLLLEVFAWSNEDGGGFTASVNTVPVYFSIIASIPQVFSTLEAAQWAAMDIAGVPE